MLRGARLLVIALFATVLASGCERVSTQEILQRAENAITSKNYRAAVIDLRSVLKEEPGNARARWLLGEVYLFIEDGFSAEKELRRADELGVGGEAVLPMLARALLLQTRVDDVLALQPAAGFPTDAAGDLYASRAMAAVYKGDLSVAQSELARAVGLAPGNPYVRYVQAEVLVAQDMDGEAVESLRQLTIQHPEQPRAWSLLGRLLARGGDFAAAEEAYSKAIGLRAAPISDTIHRGFARLSQKNYDEAEGDALAALQAAPKEARAHLLLGLTRLERREFAAAKEALDQAENLEPRDLQVVTALAIAENALGNHNRALDLAERAYALAPQGVTVRKLLAGYALREGQGSKAEQYIRPVAEQMPDDLQAQLIFARSLLMLGKTAEAAPIAAHLAVRLPDSAEAQTWAGMALMAAGQNEAGVAALTRAAELVPDSKQVSSLLIMGLMESESTAAALAAAQRYAEAHADDVEARNLLAMTYLAVGKPESGKAELQQVLARDPGNRAAARTLASLSAREGDAAIAKQILDGAIAASPRDAQLLSLRADLAVRDGDLNAVEQLLRRAVDAEPGETGLRIKLAQQLLARGDLQAAEQVLIGVQMRGNREALAIIADIAMRSGRLADARPILEELAVLMPDNLPVQYRLLKVYAAAEDRFRLGQTLDRLAMLAPKDGRVKLARARLLAESGQLDAAAALVTSSGLGASDPDVLATRLALASAAGQYEQATELGRKLLAVEPNARNAVLLGRALRAAGDSEGAMTSFDVWLETNPTDVMVLTERARLSRDLGDREAYLADLQRIAEVDSGNIFALNNLAWELRRSKPDEALHYARIASERAPGTSEVLDTLALVYADRRDFTNALRMIDRAIDLAGDSPVYRLHRAEIRAAAGDVEHAAAEAAELLGSDLPPDLRQRAERLLGDTP